MDVSLPPRWLLTRRVAADLSVHSFAFVQRHLWCGNAHSGDIVIYNVEEGTVVDRVHGHRALVSSIVLVGDATHAADQCRVWSASWDETIRIWRVHDRICESVCSIPEAAPILSMCAVHDGVMALAETGLFQFARSGELLCTVTPHDSLTPTLDTARSEWLCSSLISASEYVWLGVDRRIVVVNVEHLEHASSLLDEDDTDMHSDEHDNEQKDDNDSAVSVPATAVGDEDSIFATLFASVAVDAANPTDGADENSAALSQDSRRIVSLASVCNAHLDGHNASVTALTYVEADHSVWSGDRDGTLRAWNTVDLTALYVIERAHDATVYNLTPIGRSDARDTHVWSSSKDGRVRVWSVDGGLAEQELEPQHASAVFSIAYNQDQDETPSQTAITFDERGVCEWQYAAPPPSASTKQFAINDNRGVYLGALASHEGVAVRHGLGVNMFPNDELYAGQWKKDKRSGFGVDWLRDGDVYYGLWRRDERTEQGVFIRTDGSVFEGHYQRNAVVGNGKLALAGGIVVDGEWGEGNTLVRGRVSHHADVSAHAADLALFDRQLLLSRDALHADSPRFLIDVLADELPSVRMRVAPLVAGARARARFCCASKWSFFNRLSIPTMRKELRSRFGAKYRHTTVSVGLVLADYTHPLGKLLIDFEHTIEALSRARRGSARAFASSLCDDIFAFASRLGEICVQVFEFTADLAMRKCRSAVFSIVHVHVYESLHRSFRWLAAKVQRRLHAQCVAFVGSHTRVDEQSDALRRWFGDEAVDVSRSMKALRSLRTRHTLEAQLRCLCDGLDALPIVAGVDRRRTLAYAIACACVDDLVARLEFVLLWTGMGGAADEEKTIATIDRYVEALSVLMSLQFDVLVDGNYMSTQMIRWHIEAGLSDGADTFVQLTGEEPDVMPLVLLLEAIGTLLARRVDRGSGELELRSTEYSFVANLFRSPHCQSFMAYCSCALSGIGVDVSLRVPEHFKMPVESRLERRHSGIWANSVAHEGELNDETAASGGGDSQSKVSGDDDGVSGTLAKSQASNSSQRSHGTWRALTTRLRTQAQHLSAQSSARNSAAQTSRENVGKDSGGGAGAPPSVPLGPLPPGQPRLRIKSAPMSSIDANSLGIAMSGGLTGDVRKSAHGGGGGAGAVAGSSIGGGGGGGVLGEQHANGNAGVLSSADSSRVRLLPLHDRTKRPALARLIHFPSFARAPVCDHVRPIELDDDDVSAHASGADGGGVTPRPRRHTRSAVRIGTLRRNLFDEAQAYGAAMLSGSESGSNASGAAFAGSSSSGGSVLYTPRVMMDDAVEGDSFQQRLLLVDCTPREFYEVLVRDDAAWHLIVGDVGDGESLHLSSWTVEENRCCLRRRLRWTRREGDVEVVVRKTVHVRFGSPQKLWFCVVTERSDGARKTSVLSGWHVRTCDNDDESCVAKAKQSLLGTGDASLVTSGDSVTAPSATTSAASGASASGSGGPPTTPTSAALTALGVKSPDVTRANVSAIDTGIVEHLLPGQRGGLRRGTKEERSLLKDERAFAQRFLHEAAYFVCIAQVRREAPPPPRFEHGTLSGDLNPFGVADHHGEKEAEDNDDDAASSSSSLWDAPVVAKSPESPREIIVKLLAKLSVDDDVLHGDIDGDSDANAPQVDGMATVYERFAPSDGDGGGEMSGTVRMARGDANKEERKSGNATVGRMLRAIDRMSLSVRGSSAASSRSPSASPGASPSAMRRSRTERSRALSRSAGGVPVVISDYGGDSDSHDEGSLENSVDLDDGLLGAKTPSPRRSSLSPRFDPTRLSPRTSIGATADTTESVPTTVGDAHARDSTHSTASTIVESTANMRDVGLSDSDSDNEGACGTILQSTAVALRSSTRPSSASSTPSLQHRLMSRSGLGTPHVGTPVLGVRKTNERLEKLSRLSAASMELRARLRTADNAQKQVATLQSARLSQLAKANEAANHVLQEHATPPRVRRATSASTAANTLTPIGGSGGPMSPMTPMVRTNTYSDALKRLDEEEALALPLPRPSGDNAVRSLAKSLDAASGSERHSKRASKRKKKAQKVWFAHFDIQTPTRTYT